jgi:hypothetical protein
MAAQKTSGEKSDAKPASADPKAEVTAFVEALKALAASAQQQQQQQSGQDSQGGQANQKP